MPAALFETRTLGQIEARAAADGKPAQVAGYAAVFNSPAEIYGIFVEKIAPGAFDNAIGRDDVRCCFNHDQNYVLGRTAARTLRLASDARGLRYEADAPDAGWARDLVASIERGDINQSSFRFRATREEWDETGDMPVRTILEVELIDVAPVTYPAYEDTEVGIRAATDTLAEARSGGLLTGPAPKPSHALNAKLRMRAGLDLRARS